MNNLKQAVRNWVQAEFDFRCGRWAYTAETQARYITAERKLRRALTGKGELGKAFGVLIGEKNENETEME